jgi:hypothetical protein
MKGQIQPLLWLIVVVVVVFILIIVFGPRIVATWDRAIGQNDNFQAMELASQVILTQAAADGFFSTYNGLPNEDRRSCAKIYKTYVQVGSQKIDFAQLSPYNTSLRLATFATAQQPARALASYEPLVIDCKRGLKLVFRKAGGQVTIEASA